MPLMEARTGAYSYVNQETYQKMPFCIDMAGFDKCAKNYCVERKNFPISVVGYTLNGSGIIVQGGKTKEIKKGSLFFALCNSPHTYYSVSNWEFCWVNILGEEWCNVLSRYNLDKQLVFEDYDSGEEFKELVAAANLKETDLDKWQVAMQSFLYRTILYLYQNENFNGENQLASKIRKKFLNNVGVNKSQEALCREIGISIRHAQRIFKLEYSISIHKLITEEKIRRAQNLLINTNSSIKQISEFLGFENEKYFSVFFHKNCGETPLKYREKFGYYNKGKQKA